jgi:hypothetical protein
MKLQRHEAKGQERVRLTIEISKTGRMAMDGIGGVLGVLGAGGMSSQNQAAANQAVGVVGQSMMQMVFSQLMQNMSGFKDAMEDDQDYPNNYDGF